MIVILLHVWLEGDFYSLLNLSFSHLLCACQQMVECLVGGNNQLSPTEYSVNVAAITSYPWCKE